MVAQRSLSYAVLKAFANKLEDCLSPMELKGEGVSVEDWEEFYEKVDAVYMEMGTIIDFMDGKDV